MGIIDFGRTCSLDISCSLGIEDTRPPDKPQAQQKYWADLLGQVGGSVRRPLLSLTDEEKAIVKEAFD